MNWRCSCWMATDNQMAMSANVELHKIPKKIPHFDKGFNTHILY